MAIYKGVIVWSKTQDSDLYGGGSSSYNFAAAVPSEITCMQLHSNRKFLLYTEPKVRPGLLVYSSLFSDSSIC